jgi:hypothetical protein
MKAIIISEVDACALLDRLELVALRGAGHIMREDADKPPTMAEVHRVFHYQVVLWLQDHGADCIRR